MRFCDEWWAMAGKRYLLPGFFPDVVAMHFVRKGRGLRIKLLDDFSRFVLDRAKFEFFIENNFVVRKNVGQIC
jgi:hypothetical protein